VLIVGGNQSTGGYEVDNSLRFNDGSSDKLTRSNGTPDSERKFTFSLWTKRSNLGNFHIMQGFYTNSSNYCAISFLNNTDELDFINYEGSTTARKITNRVFRDQNAWYHIVVAVDTTQGTADNRIKMYVNGVQETSFRVNTTPSQNADLGVDMSTAAIGVGEGGSIGYYDGYMSEVCFIDNQALDPTSFGEFDSDSGIWIPKDVSGLTFGTNGYYLEFKDSSALGDDTSGNSNDFTVNNLTSNDQMPDTCTNNFCNFQTQQKNITPSDQQFSEGNTKLVNSTTSRNPLIDPTFRNYYPFSGSLYAEFLCVTRGSGPGEQTNTQLEIPLLNVNSDTPKLRWISETGVSTGQGAIQSASSGNDYSTTVASSSDLLYGNGDIISASVDFSNSQTKFFKNGTLVHTYSYGATLGAVVSIRIKAAKGSGTWVCNYGQDSSFAGNKTRQSNADADGIGNFYYSEGSNHNAICSKNAPKFMSITIDKPSDYFETKLYTGNGGTQNITGLDFAPDWVWLKSRSNGNYHNLSDTVRGVNKQIYSNDNTAEASKTTVLTAFNSDGFTLGSESDVNGSGRTFVSWNWLGGGTASSNTDGSITSTVSANTTSGFSIVKYTGTETAGATVGHGLGQTPDVIIVKNYSVTKEWNVYHANNTSTPQNDYLILNETNSSNSNSGRWNNTAPSSSIFTLGDGSETNGNGNTHIAYCFAGKTGFSRFANYKANGNSSTSIYQNTTFTPAFMIIKRRDGTGDWMMYDNERGPFNPNETILKSNTADSESTSSGFAVDFLSNGFKIRGTDSNINTNNGNYIIMAFAENPFVSSTGIPATAR